MEIICGGKYTPKDGYEDETLFMAKNNDTGEEIALKRIPAHREEAMTELRIWRDFYPELYKSHFMENGWLYIERAWISGDTLYEFCEKNKKPGDVKALKITLMILDELERFQEKTGFVHGDLNLGNVIIDDNKAWLIDFESAGYERNFFEIKNHSKKRTVKFVTQNFTAPEKLAGEVSYKSDFFSVGAILKELGAESETSLYIADKLSAQNPDDRYDEIKEAKKDIEDAIKKLEGISKSILFKNNVFGYRKLILYVPENFSFAAELTTMLALNGINAGCLEVCDLSDGVAEYYFRDEESADPQTNYYGLIASEGGVEYAKSYTCSKSNKPLLSREYTRHGSSKCLRYSVRKTEPSECPDIDDMRDFLVNCYSDFDVTVVCDESFSGSDLKAQLMRFSDYCIVPSGTDVDAFEKTMKTYLKFMENSLIPRERLLMVAWNYEENVSAPENIFEKSGAEYLGKISRDINRERLKNIDGRFYVDVIDSEIKKEYGKIIRKILAK